MKKNIALAVAPYIDNPSNYKITKAWAEPYQGEWVVVVSPCNGFNVRYRTLSELRSAGFDFLKALVTK